MFGDEMKCVCGYLDCDVVIVVFVVEDGVVEF